MLSRPADASDAVQDTFVVAAAKLGRLRDPGRLRPWLFAVARNECRRQLDGPHVSRSAEGPGRHRYPWIDRVRIRQDRRGGQEDQPPRHPDADQDQAQHAAELAPGHHAGQHPTNYLADDRQSDAHADQQRRGQQPDRLDYRDTVGGVGATLASARSSAAAIRRATSLPNADSRGRYFIPQSGASTSRSAGT